MSVVMAVGGGVHTQSLLEKSWAQGHLETRLVKTPELSGYSVDQELKYGE